MTYNLVSLKQVIAKLYGDLSLNEIQHPVSDFISWGAEAVERIGALGALESKVSILTLKDYKSVLPNDFKSLSQAAYAVSPRGPWYVMSKSSGNFFAYKCNVGVTDSDVEDIYSAMSNMPLQRMIEFARQLTAYQTGDKGNVVRGVLNYEQAAKLVNSDPFIRDTMAALAEAKDKSGGWTYDLNKRDQTTPVYQIWNGVLKCSHRWGFIGLAYKALPLDDEGYPMVIDHASAIEAVYWYIVMKYYYPKWVAGEINERVYSHAEQSWAHYSRQSYGIALMPDQGDMQGIKNMWLRLIPDLKADEHGFEDLYKPEDIRL